MTATAVILTPGDTLGGFRVAEVIGVGGMAIVYRARQLSLDREVALKVLSPELAKDEMFSERFRAEGMHAARLDHPNVIPVYDAGEEDGRLYLAMRLVEGMSLAELLRANPLSARQTLDILGPIAAGLDAAHAIGLIHRDVKPQNILLTDAGHPYLADFGVAKGVESAGLTASGGFVGTLNYAAPEQILGLATQPATDVYGLAALLYHCMTGGVPYPRDTQAGLMFAQLNQSPPRIPLPEAGDFNLVMEKGMAKEPEDRFASAGELIAAAEHAIGRLSEQDGSHRPAFSSSPASATWSSAAQPAQPARRRARPLRRATIALAAVLVLVAAGIAAATFGTRAAAASGKVAQSPPVTIRYRAPWRLATGGAFAAFALTAGHHTRTPAPIELTDGLASLAAGTLMRSSTDPGGLPPALRSRFRRPSAIQDRRGTAVAVYRWTLSTVRNLTAWVIPTTAGDLAVICSAPVGMAGAMRSCDAMAAAVRVSGVDRIPVGPDRALARTLTAILSKARADRSGLARMFGRQSSGSSPPSRLAAADETAQDSVRKLKVPPRYAVTVAALASELGSEAQALLNLSHAAATHNRRGYGKAAAVLRTVDQELAGAGTDLRREELLRSTLPPLVIPRMPLVRAALSPSSRTVTPSQSTNATTTYPTTTIFNPPAYVPPSTQGTNSTPQKTGSHTIIGPVIK